MKKLLLILLITILTFTITACKKDDGSNNYSGNNGKNTSQDESDISNDSYEASVYFENGHYVLNIFTNLSTDKIKFTYDAKKFLINDTLVLFDGATITEKGNKKTYEIQLESNTLYKFDFIPLGNDELKIGTNITLE